MRSVHRRPDVPAREFDATFFIGTTPDIEFDDGLFLVTYEIGKQARAKVVMRPSVFLKAMLLAEGAIAKWRLDEMPSNNVTAIRK